MHQLLQATGVTPSHYSSHSFLIGAATTAAAAGLPATLIKTLGWWKSCAYESYVQFLPSSLHTYSFFHTSTHRCRCATHMELRWIHLAVFSSLNRHALCCSVWQVMSYVLCKYVMIMQMPWVYQYGIMLIFDINVSLLYTYFVWFFSHRFT